MKKLLSMLICIILTLPAMAVNAETEGTYGYLKYKLNADHVEISGYNSLPNEVIIPSTIEGLPVTTIAAQTFRGCNNITNVVLPDDIISIGRYAFCDCSNLKSINIPNAVLSIEEGAFCYCHSLTSIDLSNNLCNIDMWAFRECDSLTTINIPANVTSIGMEAFLKCSSLTNIYVDENNSKYTSVDGVLFDKQKTSLITYPVNNDRTNYTIPNGVLNIANFAFLECANLTNVTIPDGVEKIYSQAFYGCKKLEKINIPDSVIYLDNSSFYDTAYYNNSDNWESGCLYLDKYLIASDRDVLSGIYTVKDGTLGIAGGVFWGCNNLTKVIINQELKSLGSQVFWNCSNLESVYMPKSIIEWGHMNFWNCDKMTDIYYGGTKTQWEEANVAYYYRDTITVHYNAIGTASPTILETNIKDNIYDTGKCLEISLDNTEYDSKLITVFSNGSIYNSFNLTDIFAGDTSKQINIPQNSKFAKVFIWDSLSGMKPLCEAQEIPIE